MSVILDTCAILHWLGAGQALPAAIASAPKRTPAVTWCEIAWKHRAGRLDLPMPRDVWIAKASELVETVSIDTALFLAAVDLPWDHRDPADRLVVALARREQAPVVTCDTVIRAWYPHCVW